LSALGGGDAALLAAAGVAAGAVNAVAGGGSLISFPALLATGLSPLSANATNIVAVLPGYVGSAAAYRRELRGQRHRALRLGVVAALGAVAGAGLLLASPAALFETIVPFLVLAACGLLAAQPLLRPHPGGRDHHGLVPATFAAAIYGGYFGAALGVMLLAVLGAMTAEDLQRANALKAVLSLVIAAASAVLLALFGPIDWGAAGIVAAGSLVGGHAGGTLARRLDATLLRWAVVAIGVALAIIFFFKR
jgi:uncharacterized membrane protein YfcA